MRTRIVSCYFIAAVDLM